MEIWYLSKESLLFQLLFAQLLHEIAADVVGDWQSRVRLIGSHRRRCFRIGGAGDDGDGVATLAQFSLRLADRCAANHQCRLRSRLGLAAALGKARLQLFMERDARLVARRKARIDLVGADRRTTLWPDYAIRRADRIAEIVQRHLHIPLRVRLARRRVCAATDTLPLPGRLAHHSAARAWAWSSSSASSWAAMESGAAMARLLPSLADRSYHI
jgi:hypothetical protein